MYIYIKHSTNYNLLISEFTYSINSLVVVLSTWHHLESPGMSMSLRDCAHWLIGLTCGHICGNCLVWLCCCGKDPLQIGAALSGSRPDKKDAKEGNTLPHILLAFTLPGNFINPISDVTVFFADIRTSFYGFLTIAEHLRLSQESSKPSVPYLG